MGKQRYTPEEITHKLREAEVLIGPASVSFTTGRRTSTRTVHCSCSAISALSLKAGLIVVAASIAARSPYRTPSGFGSAFLTRT